MHVIQWGVNVEKFEPGAPDATLASKLGVSGRPVVFSPRSFRPLYNLESIVSAFALVVAQVPNAMLLMKNYKGEDPYTQLIKKHIDALGLSESVRIVYDMPYERMRELYRMSTVTVSVPFSDATSMSVLEAMSCGSAPIVSDLPSLREWVQDGWNGYLVPPMDTKHLAARIIDVLKHPDTGAEWARRNRKLVEEKANQAAHMGYMTDIYRNVLKVNASLALGLRSRQSSLLSSYNSHSRLPELAAFPSSLLFSNPSTPSAASPWRIQPTHRFNVPQYACYRAVACPFFFTNPASTSFRCRQRSSTGFVVFQAVAKITSAVA